MASPAPGDPATFAPRDFIVAGRGYSVRPLTPADAERLQEFFYSHTLETIQLRYGHAVARMTRERAIDLVSVDQSRDLALCVVEHDGPRENIHAVGRYYLDPDGTAGESAFVVRESCRRRGFATRLMTAMVDVARRRGLVALWGYVRRDNLPMLALFRKFGGEPARDTTAPEAELRMVIPLRDQRPPPRARPKVTRPKADRRRTTC
jgi:GNAT superfamily N-acetyltransferase